MDKYKDNPEELFDLLEIDTESIVNKYHREILDNSLLTEDICAELDITEREFNRRYND